MVKWKFRSCPRCGGDMFIHRDLYGWSENCLQCGYTGDLRSTVEFVQQQACSEEGKKRRVTILSKGGSR